MAKLTLALYSLILTAELAIFGTNLNWQVHWGLTFGIGVAHYLCLNAVHTVCHEKRLKRGLLFVLLLPLVILCGVYACSDPHSRGQFFVIGSLLLFHLINVIGRNTAPEPSAQQR